MYIDKQSTFTKLEVERIGYPNKRVSLKYSTLSLGTGYEMIGGVKVYHAQDGKDYETSFGEITFLPGEVSFPVYCMILFGVILRDYS